MFGYFRGAEELMAQQEPEEYPVQTDTPCPTCGRLVEWSGYSLYCGPRGAAWDNFAELQSDIAHARREAIRRCNDVARQINDEERQRVVAAALDFGRAHRNRTGALAQ